MLINSADWADSYPTLTSMIDYRGAFVRPAEYATASKRPQIEVTYTAAGVTQNAIIFGTNFSVSFFVEGLTISISAVSYTHLTLPTKA